ncbi:MAG: helix-turn-helix domain-containing protein [Lactobacillus helveticus]
MNNTHKEMLKHLRQLLRDKKITQDEMGEKIGITRVAMNNMLAGRTGMPVKRLKQILTILGEPLTITIGNTKFRL